MTKGEDDAEINVEHRRRRIRKPYKKSQRKERLWNRMKKEIKQWKIWKWKKILRKKNIETEKKILKFQYENGRKKGKLEFDQREGRGSFGNL